MAGQRAGPGSRGRPKPPRQVIPLTPREWELLEALRAHRTRADIAEMWGTSPQYVTNMIKKLQGKGAIVRQWDLTHAARYHHTERYPWIVRTDIDLRFRLAMPPDAKLRLEYPRDSKRDHTAAPVRVCTWDEGGWVVQGVPCVNPDNSSQWSKLPEYWPVWCVQLNGEGLGWVFLVPVRSEWRESDTIRVFQEWPSPEGALVFDLTEDCEVINTMTMMIAAVTMSEAVLDVSGGKCQT